MSIYARKVRYRELDRLRHSDNFLNFLANEAARLSGTGTPTTVTFTNTTDLVNLTAHGFVDGQGPFLLSNSGGALPTGLDAVTQYWVNSNDANSFTLHLTEEDGLSVTNPVDFATDGTGTNSLLVAAEMVDIFAAMLNGKGYRQIAALTSIDNL